MDDDQDSENDNERNNCNDQFSAPFFRVSGIRLEQAE